jgi:hypothetical protein
MKILQDVFPAHLVVVPTDFLESLELIATYPRTKGSTYVGTTRVILTDEMIIVAKDSPDGPQIIFQERYTTYLRPESKKDDHKVLTESGKMLAFRVDSACGCGSRLRSWNPYKTIGLKGTNG